MALVTKVAVIHERQADGAWKAVGVLRSKPDGVDGQFLHDEPGWNHWLENLPRVANPPFRDGRGINPARGTWHDWIEWAVYHLTNGHTTWLVLIVEPEPTLGANFERFVLAAIGAEASWERQRSETTRGIGEVSS